ncbi:hypothetical protein I5Q34_13230 [Streptomyces sp. AV19]|uniref:hypothetical protein n=1 Tax=Streptomyces sp. AV19 TaxID=2793068 RepID=UPI0018FE7F34|nr:hypothetical protein [Streptomyces sp. AV19]MBH1935226.1 hypothetical protein [Streptomyces sp. AV19]MDG4531127.1 hypothetical protein [Streptomyces sp. AV19]
MAELTTIELPFTFSVPEAFEDCEFALSPEERADRFLAKLSALDPKPSDEELLHALLAQQSLVDQLANAGCVYAGVMLTRPEPPRKGIASLLLTVTVRPSELSGDATLERLAQSMAATYPTAEVGVVVLPAGPAVLCTEETKVGGTVNLLGAGGGDTVVRQLHVFVPIPGRTAMADFSVSTENTADWEHYVEILAGVCRTIQFASS